MQAAVVRGAALLASQQLDFGGSDFRDAIILIITAVNVTFSIVMMSFALFLLIIHSLDSVLIGADYLLYPTLILLLGSVINITYTLILYMGHSSRRTLFKWSKMLVIYFLALIMVVLGTGWAWKNRTMLSIVPVGAPELHKFQLQDGLIRDTFKKEMLNSLRSYNTSMNGDTWDADQSRMMCCGVEGPKDWLLILAEVPLSCCPKPVRVMKTCDNPFPTGCLDAMVIDHRIGVSFMASLGLFVIASMIPVLILNIKLWKKERNPYAKFYRKSNKFDFFNQEKETTTF